MPLEGNDLQHEARKSLRQILPRVEAELAPLGASDHVSWHEWHSRLEAEWQRLFGLLFGLYGSHYDLIYELEKLVITMGKSWLQRPAWLKKLDTEREANPAWFRSEKMIGGVAYVDLFAGSLRGMSAHIPYFRELGLTYLHLMPLFLSPEGNSDGGYAVSSYREIDPRLGTIDDLRCLARELRENGISLVVDFVFNHTSDEHEWARRAREGDPDCAEFYWLFADREMPDAYERTLREIFPTVRRGSFTWRKDMQKWVWTTFNSFQWDLNYSNPAVFCAMAGEMLHLANIGVEVLRLDAVAFIWKRLGTACENLPEAHMIIQAMNSVARVAAPSLLFKSEAIVHPDEVARYISPWECQISYNPLLMALLWEALATREVRLLEHSMRIRFAIPAGCAWVNYLRSHDDIGWTFDDEEARRVGIDPQGHRRFLNDFYTGKFPGSFACGVPFQENSETGDARVSGTLASLAGLEQAEQASDPRLIDLAVRRILMLHGIILSIGGIPLIYLGDEIGTTNDYGYLEDPHKAGDSRWVHRPVRDWSRKSAAGSPEERIASGLRLLIDLRKRIPQFYDQDMRVVTSGNPHVFAFERGTGPRAVLVLANFSENEQQANPDHGQLADLITGQVCDSEPITLPPYALLWLTEPTQDVS